jgi:hypothetical protein
VAGETEAVLSLGGAAPGATSPIYATTVLAARR